MATLRQKALAQNLVKNAKQAKPLNKQQLLEKVGYSRSMATTRPTAIIESKGVKKELEIMGFTEDAAKKVVSKILNDDFEESPVRLRAAELVFDVHGTKAATKSISMNVNSEELRAQIIAGMAKFKAS